MPMQQKLIDLSTKYLQAGNALHDAVRDERGLVQIAGERLHEDPVAWLQFLRKVCIADRNSGFVALHLLCCQSKECSFFQKKKELFFIGRMACLFHIIR